jgi:very-short-patch-repair endonuclease
MCEVLRLVELWCKRMLIALVLGLFTPAVLWAQSSLENPQPGSVQSGIGLISGWVCTASRIDIEIDGTITLQAAYGTARSDTVSVCGKADNGFGLLVNWNLLPDGTHTVRALKDGAEFTRVTFTVATLGLGDFPRGLSGNFTLPNFPQPGRSTRLQWQESVQNFVITNATGTSTGGGSTSPGTALENPQPGSFQSGIGLISGWVCSASRVDIEIDGSITLQAAYGTARGDTLSACGDTNNGFGLLVNWNLLGDGSHTLRALRDGVEFARATFTVATLGLGDFPRGLSGTFELANFPQTGKTTHIQWQESLQSFIVTEVTNNPTGECVNIAGEWYGEESVTYSCIIDGDETGEETVDGETDIIIEQNDCNVSWTSEDFEDLGIPPRTATIKGNTLQGSGKFILQTPEGPKLKFSQNAATYQGTINGNRITLSGSGSARGEVCDGGECVDFSCTGTSTGLFTR